MKKISALAMMVALATGVVSCKSGTLTVQPPGDVTAVDPDVPECSAMDPKPLLEEHLADLQHCTRYLGCRTNHIRTVTLMIGCNGTQGALYVLSHKDLKKYNQCMVEKGETWDFSAYCQDASSECAWTIPVDIQCKVD